jgi:hypothetical protein
LISVAWGALGPLLALVVVGCFGIFAVRLMEEIRSLEAEATAIVELDPGDVPWLARRSDEESAESSTEDRAAETEELRPVPRLDLPILPRLELGERPAPAETLPAERHATPVEPAADRVPATARMGFREPVYELREVVAGRRQTLQIDPSFLEVSDFAFEFIEENDPAELEIVRVVGEQQETVWTYRRSESAAERARTEPSDVFGFDVTRWSGPPHLYASRRPPTRSKR